VKARSVGAAVFILTLLSSCAVTPRPAMRAWPIRLTPEADLRVELEKFVREHDIRAAYVAACAGSLERAVIRFADQKESTTLDGRFEIVSLTGTIAVSGAHLHVSVADGTGRTIGGHLSEGSRVYTTAEIVLVELRDVEFRRETDPATTYRELVIRPR
jgi:predicted DNA-binding protein with PD1-like motif